VLCENGRLNELPAVITDFATLMRAHRKEIEVTITSAESLDSEDLGSIKDALGNLKKSVSPLCPYQHLPRTRTRPQSQGVCLGSSSHGISACIWGRIAWVFRVPVSGFRSRVAGCLGMLAVAGLRVCVMARRHAAMHAVSITGACWHTGHCWRSLACLLAVCCLLALRACRCVLRCLCFVVWAAGWQDESFIISEKVDPALLGGVIVQLGDKYVDLSTIRRIREIERILAEPV
jgi:hypothetical protein